MKIQFIKTFQLNLNILTKKNKNNMMKNFKKLILTGVIALLSLVSLAQTSTFDADHLAIKFTGGAWSDWVDLSPYVPVTVTGQNLIITSSTPQLFTFSSVDLIECKHFYHFLISRNQQNH